MSDPRTMTHFPPKDNEATIAIDEIGDPNPVAETPSSGGAISLKDRNEKDDKADVAAEEMADSSPTTEHLRTGRVLLILGSIWIGVFFAALGA